MRPVAALVALELRRFLSDRFNLFFVLVLPLVLVFVLGLQNGGGTGRVALVGDGPAVTRLVERLQAAGAEVSTYPDRDAAARAVSGGGADLGVVVADPGRQAAPLSLELLAVDGQAPPALEPVVRQAAQQEVLDQERVTALREAGLDDGEAEEAARSGPPGWTPAGVDVAGGDGFAQEMATAGRFDLGAGGQLLLFVFLNTMTAASATIQARRSGALRRVVAAPVTAGQTVTGLVLGRFVIALVQGAYIVVASRLLLGVEWGHLGAVLVVVAVFGLIAAGLAVLLGVLLDAEGPASGVAVGAGLVLAALGGCMVPLELFPDGLRAAADLTPHAWAYQALAEIQRRGGGVGDVLPELAVLGAMALAVLAAGTLLLRRSLQRAV